MYLTVDRDRVYQEIQLPLCPDLTVRATTDKYCSDIKPVPYYYTRRFVRSGFTDEGEIKYLEIWPFKIP
jgi:hypothetical protein